MERVPTRELRTKEDLAIAPKRKGIGTGWYDCGGDIGQLELSPGRLSSHDFPILVLRHLAL